MSPTVCPITTKMKRLALLAWLLLLVPVRPASAIEAKHSPKRLDKLTFFQPDLYISSANVPLERLLHELPNRSAWSAFLSSRDGRDAQIWVDPRSGNPSNIIASVPLIPGPGAGNTLTHDDLGAVVGSPVREVNGDVVARVVRRFLEDHRSMLGVDLDQLGEVRAVPVNSYLWQVHIPQRYQGIPVRHGRVAATINNGNLVVIGMDTWSNVTISPVPTLDSTQALELGFGHVGGRATEDVILKEPTLEVVPYAPAEYQKGEAFAGPLGRGYGHRLVWGFVFQRPPDLARWEAMVDAHTSTVLSFQDINRYADHADQDAELHAEHQIKGAVFPTTNTEICPAAPRCGTAQPGYPMPFADTGLPPPNDFTNSGGVFEHAGGFVGTTLAGKYLKIKDNCGSISETSPTGGIDLGGATTQHDCASAGQSAGDTASSRTAFYELNKVAEEARGWLPANAWLSSPLPANVNINSACNAFYDFTSVNFFKSGAGCRNTGEIAAVFDHEWGHGLDDNDANGTLSNSSEAYADIAAIYRLQDSCVGYGFFHTRDWGCGQTSDGTGFNIDEDQLGGQHCALNCSGVRDADWDQHADHAPDTALGFVCSKCGGGDGPCGRQVHCAATPARQAAWDLVARDLRAAPFNLDRHTAFIIGDKLFYQGSGNITSWHACACGQSSDGCAASNAYMQWLTADDDNGNLSDGTPHMTAIHAAFDRHGIACGTPTPRNSGCVGSPSAAPTVSVTRGEGQNQVSWTSVPGAARYWVFRTEGHAGCNLGKVLLANVTGTSHSDTAVASSRDYCYNVMAVGSSSACFGPASACACTSPAAPDFTLACNPASLAVQRGSSGTSTCTVTSQGGFSGAVSLSCLDLPAGVTCGYSPNPVTLPPNGSVESTLSVSAGPSAPTGTTTVRARGVSGTLDKSFGITLQVTDQPPAEDFALACAPSSLTVVRGASATSTCTLTSQNGFSSAVGLDCLDLPSGVTCGFNPSPATPPANGTVNSTLSLTVAASAPPGPFTFKARGRSGLLDRRFDVALMILPGAIPCQNGNAGGFPCKDVDLMAQLPLSAIGGGSGSSSWGWTDPQTGKEYALMGRSTGTSFVDISVPQSPVYLGNLPTHTGTSSWREMKVYRNHAYIVSDVNGAHGMQIFDLTRLRDVPNPPVIFTETAHYAGFQRAHNLAINEATGFAYAVGTETCAGGLHMMHLLNPTSPAFVGCFGGDGYTHDLQCVVYNGPDAAYRGQEVCFASNEDTVTLVNVQSKSAPTLIAKKSYPGVGYVHQGWLTEDHRYFLQDDELDERTFGHNSRTYVWDMSDLDNPNLLSFYQGPTKAIDHNLYVKGNHVHEANYRAGLRILSLTNVGNAQLQEVAFFDIYPPDDNPEFNGAWNNYPFYGSGLVTVSGIEQGLFILKPRLGECSPPSAPTLVSPPNGAVSVALTPVLDWSDVLGAATYEVQVATDPSFANVVRSAANLTASTWTVSPALTGNLIYHWRARAVNSCGPGVWTAGWSFRTQCGLLPAPTLLNPPNGAANVAVTPVLDWTDELGAATYDVQVATDPSFNNMVRSANGLTASTWTVSPALNPGVTYFWRARGVNGCGAGVWTAGWSFTTEGCMIPAAPTLVSPPNGATNVPVAPTLDWADVPGALSYLVLVFDDANNLLRLEFVQTSSWVVSPALDPGKVHRWQVAARNACGWGAWSETWSFTTIAQCTLPSAPTPISPRTGANVAPAAALDWSDVPEAVSYQVQVATDPNFTNVVRSATDLVRSFWRVSPELDDGTTYFWRTRALNACGPGAWSNDSTFTTCIGLGTPMLLSPPNGEASASMTPTLDWNGVTSAVSYYVRVFDSSGTTAADAVLDGSTSSWTVTPALSPSTNYLWQVVTFNACGLGGWSPAWTFTTGP